MSTFQFDRPSAQQSQSSSNRAQWVSAPAAEPPVPAHQQPCAQADGEP